MALMGKNLRDLRSLGWRALFERTQLQFAGGQTTARFEITLEAHVDNTIPVNPTDVAAFPPLDLDPNDDLGPNLAFSKFTRSAKASVILEMLRSGTYHGKTCALILLKVSFLYHDDSRLQNATIKVTVSAPTGTNQTPPSFAHIAPKTEVGDKTPVQHTKIRQRGIGFTIAAPVASIGANVSASTTRETTYTTYTAKHITCSSDRLIQDCAEFIFEEDREVKAGIRTSLVVGLITILPLASMLLKVGVLISSVTWFRGFEEISVAQIRRHHLTWLRT